MQTSGAFASLLFGLSLAALALVRAALLPFAFVALAWFLLASRQVTRGWLCALVAFLGFVIGLAPGRYAITGTSASRCRWPTRRTSISGIGNNQRATGGPAGNVLESAPVEELQNIAHQPSRYARAAREWWGYVQEHPLATLKHRFWATAYFLFGERGSRRTSSRKSDRRKLHQCLAGWRRYIQQRVLAAGLFFLAFLGWRWTRGWAATAMPSALAVIWVPLPYILGHAEALHGPRLPLDGILLCYAAFALCCLVPGVGGRLLRGAVSQRPKKDHDDFS